MKMLRNTALLGAAYAILSASTAMSATEAQKLSAIQSGLTWLTGQQQAGGQWNYNGYLDAGTAVAVSAFISQKDNWGSNSADYQARVDAGMAYLLSTATKNTVGIRTDGKNPCAPNPTCTGIYWYGGGQSTYTTGLVATAIGQYAVTHPNDVATMSGPLAGMTWKEIAQGVTNEFAAGQTTAAGGFRRGGWRYTPFSNDADGSTTQWAVLSMLYGQSLGAVTPQFVKDELKYWLAVDQAANGAGCYQPGSYCEQSDTGSLLLGLRFVGDPLSDSNVQAALDFLDARWTEDANNTWYGNFGNPYAMWAEYKALETYVGIDDTTTITHLKTDCGASAGNLPGDPAGSTACNWFEDYNHYLVNTQSANGSWGGYGYWTGVLATSWNLSILAATHVPDPDGVPLPSTLSSLGIALAALTAIRRRRRPRASGLHLTP